MPNFSDMDLTEIVFLRRNKEYGAYQLRRSYVRSTALALGIGTGFLVLAFLIPGIIAQIKSAMPKDDLSAKEAEMVLEEPPPMNEEEEPPPPPEAEPPPPPKKSEIQFVPPKVVKEEEAPPEQTIASVDSVLKTDAEVGKQTQEGDPNALPNLDNLEVGGTGTQPVEVAQPEKEPTADEFVFVQQEPKPANLDEIKRSIVYPEILRENQIQGKVFVKILVDKEGNPVKHVIKKSPHPLMTQEIESKIYKLKFSPAINAGKPVKFWVSIPFDFKLK